MYKLWFLFWCVWSKVIHPKYLYRMFLRSHWSSSVGFKNKLGTWTLESVFLCEVICTLYRLAKQMQIRYFAHPLLEGAHLFGSKQNDLSNYNHVSFPKKLSSLWFCTLHNSGLRWHFRIHPSYVHIQGRRNQGYRGVVSPSFHQKICQDLQKNSLL